MTVTWIRANRWLPRSMIVQHASTPDRVDKSFQIASNMIKGRPRPLLKSRISASGKGSSESVPSAAAQARSQRMLETTSTRSPGIERQLHVQPVSAEAPAGKPHPQGTSRLDRAGRVVASPSLSQLNVIDRPSDIRCQLDDIRALEDGWLDGEGRAPSLSGIDWIESRLHRHLPADLPRPYLYPTEAGGVQLEWSIESNEISIEVSLESHLGIWHQVSLKPQQTLHPSDERERELNLDDASDWEWIIRQINCMMRMQ